MEIAWSKLGTGGWLAGAIAFFGGGKPFGLWVLKFHWWGADESFKINVIVETEAGCTIELVGPLGLSRRRSLPAFPKPSV